MEKAEIMQSRRQFLKKSLTVAAGLAVTSKMGSLATALAEEPTATATPEPYKWIPSAPPCKLIEEITAADAPEGTRSFKFTTDGRTCSKSVTFDIVGGDYILKNVVYDGGCNGGTQGIGAMAEGRPSEEVAGILSSNGLKAAVADALTAAGLDPTTYGYEEVSTELLPPCMLIKEVEPEEEGYRSFYYTTQGNTCSDHITFSTKEDDMTVHNLVVYGGCSGTAAGFGALCEGQTVDYCVERMGGILCHGSNGSSCPDQSAKALAAAKGLIDGTLCDNCGAAE